MNLDRARKNCRVFVAILLLSGTARAGGLDYHHHWAFDVGGYKGSISEIEGMGRHGIRFTRVRIHNRGRDFQCRIWVFAAVVLLIPLGGVTGLTMLIQRRQRENR